MQLFKNYLYEYSSLYFPLVNLTLQEIWTAMRGSVQKSKKAYTRKSKHKDTYKG